MTVALGALAFVFLLSLAIERAAAAREAPRIAPSACPARLGLAAVLHLFWLGVFLRPGLAGFAALTTIAVVTAISVRKRQLVAEPLVFSDFGLLRLVLRHPDLYYLGFFSDARFIAGALAFAAGLGLWLWLEPPSLSWPAGLLLALSVLGSIGLLWSLAGQAAFRDALGRLVPGPELERHVGRWGLLLTLAAYGLRWRGETLRPSAAETAEDPFPDGPDLVVVLQLESFVDPARSGLPPLPLPGLDRARALSRVHGPLAVPAHGAFTMRSEYAVLTGLSGAQSGFRQFDPYLSSAASTPPTLATRLTARGYRTLFIHPFRASFFNRETVMPRLGFAETLWEEDFAGAERVGPYVGDRALAQRILAESQRGDRPQLIMAVSMENHGPWSAGRLADEPDPTRQYLRHLANGDAAIAMLIDGLSSRNGCALLCVYGDHPPILPGIDLARPPETEYVVMELGRGAPAPTTEHRQLAVDGLGRLLLALSRGGRGEVPPA